MQHTTLPKLRRWEVWERADGSRYLTFGQKQHPAEHETLVQTFLAADWLSAEREAFGHEPELDAGVQPLLEVISLFPGVLTMAACEGHPERGDDCAVLGLSFDDLGALRGFLSALQTVAHKNPDLRWDLRLEEQRMAELPDDALALEWMVFDENGVPSAELLRGLAHTLLAASGVAEITAIPTPHRSTLSN